eukprot:1797052-Amphidinium_carterae.2
MLVAQVEAAPSGVRWTSACFGEDGNLETESSMEQLCFRRSPPKVLSEALTISLRAHPFVGCRDLQEGCVGFPSMRK